jgi:hypothetical protein
MLVPTKEVDMGFFDRLFGRGKDVAEDVGQKAEEYGDKAMDTPKDVGQTAEEAFDTAKEKVTGGEGETPQQPPERPPQQP